MASMADLRILDEEMKKKRKKKQSPNMKTERTAQPSLKKSQAQPSSGGSKFSVMQGLQAAGSASGSGEDTSTSGNMASGAAKGAAVGGPWGAVIGAGVGLVKAQSKKKKERKRLEAEAVRQQGRNIQKTAVEKQNAIKNIMDGLRAAFIF